MLPLALVCLVAGLLFVSIDIWWLTGLLMTLCAIGIVVATVLAKRRRAVGVVCLAALLAAYLMLVPMGQYLGAMIGDEISAQTVGRIAMVSADENGKIDALVLDHLQINGRSVGGKASVDLRYQTTAAMGYVYADAGRSDYVVGIPLEIGQTVSVKGTLTGIKWHYFDSAAMHNIVRKVYFRLRADGLAMVDATPRLGATEKVRVALYRTLAGNMSGQSAGMAYAFLTGNASFVPDDVLAGYRSSGAAHLLAVSGLHVGLVAGLLALLLKRLRCPSWGRTIVLAAVLGVYAWLCGDAPSVWRATALVVGGSLCSALGRRRDAPSLLSGCGLVLLAVRPLWLFDVSFLLSFAAYAGVVLLYAPLRKVLRRVPGRWGNALALNVAVTLSTLPISVYFFGGFAPLCIPLNFVLIPVMSVVYVVLFACALVSVVPALGILLTGLDYVLRVVNAAVVALGGVGYLGLRFEVWHLPLYYGAAALASPYCLPRKAIRYSAAAATVLLLAVWTLVDTFA